MQALVEFGIGHLFVAMDDPQLHREIETADPADVRTVLEILLDQQVRPRVAAGTRGFVFGTRRNVEQQRTVGKAGDLLAGIGVRNAVPPFDRNGSAQIVLAGPLGHLPDRIGVAPSETDRIRIGLFEPAVLLHDFGPQRRYGQPLFELRIAENFHPGRLFFPAAAFAAGRVAFRTSAETKRDPGQRQYPDRDSTFSYSHNFRIFRFGSFAGSLPGRIL